MTHTLSSAKRDAVHGPIRSNKRLSYLGSSHAFFGSRSRLAESAYRELVVKGLSKRKTCEASKE